MERLPAVSLCRFGFEVVPDADAVRQRPADRDAEPDARDPQRRGRKQIGQRHAGAQRGNGIPPFAIFNSVWYTRLNKSYL